MNEIQLNKILGTISEPEKNVYIIKGDMKQKRKRINEIHRLCRIFKITEEQKIKHRMLAIKNLATMKVVFSNN